MYAQRYSFRTYQQTEGLTNPNLRSLAQDSAGYLWAGTRRGLFRYDGEKFHEFQGAPALPSRLVRAIKTAPDGALWVASWKGLTRIRGERVDNVTLPGPFSSFADAALDIDANGVVYFGGSDGVLAVRNSSAPDHLIADYLPGAPRNNVQGLHCSRDGVLWIAADDAIWRLALSESRSAAKRMSVPADKWVGIQSDRTGAVWIRSATHLMERAKGASDFESRDRGLPVSTTTAVLNVDSSQNLYVPTDFGLAFQEPGKPGWSIVSSKQGLPSDAVTCLLEDREGSMWLGLNGGGVARWLGFEEWSSWTRHEGLASDLVWAVREAPNHNLWVGSDGGLTLLRPGSGAIRTWTERDGLAGNHVRAVTYGPDGRLWIASAPGGVSVMDVASGRVHSFDPDQGIAAESAFSLAFASGSVWVGTSAGVYRGMLQNGSVRFARVKLAGEDPFEMFLSLNVDARGRLWAAGTQGVAMWNGAAWNRIWKPAGHSEELTSVASSGNDVWVGSALNGLTRIREANGGFQFEHFDSSTGLTSDTVYVIGTDRAGRVWVGENAGLDVRDGKRWKHFGAADGLVSDDTNAGAFLADSSGAVWIGTSRGLSRFIPSVAERAEPPPSLILSATDEKQRILSPAQYEERPYRGRSIGFHFVALTYRNEDDVRFGYRLSPLDGSWIVTDQHRIVFPALSPGSYTFEVKAQTSDGVWSQPKSISFRVLPPWWMRWWSMAAFLALSVYFLRQFFHNRMKRLVETKMELEAAVSARTLELEREKADLLIARERLADKAMRDGLTGLWNRTATFEILQRELHRARRGERPIAVILADIDNFKAINDSHGHLTGDAVLIETARRISAHLRSYDSAGRYGGEEFIMILANCGHSSLLTRAEELRSFICSEPVAVQGGNVTVTCSFGVAISTGEAGPFELIEAADRALYRAKRSGKNRVMPAFVPAGATAFWNEQSEPELKVQAPRCEKIQSDSDVTPDIAALGRALQSPSEWVRGGNLMDSSEPG